MSPDSIEGRTSLGVQRVLLFEQYQAKSPVLPKVALGRLASCRSNK